MQVANEPFARAGRAVASEELLGRDARRARLARLGRNRDADLRRAKDLVVELVRLRKLVVVVGCIVVAFGKLELVELGRQRLQQRLELCTRRRFSENRRPARRRDTFERVNVDAFERFVGRVEFLECVRRRARERDRARARVRQTRTRFLARSPLS